MDEILVTELGAAVAELTHPFGNHAFVQPLKRRANLPVRAHIVYRDFDEDDEAAKGEAVPLEDGGLIDESDTPAAMAHAPAAAGKRKRPHIVKSVRLPNWMDLDQELLPYGGPVRALVDTVVKKTTNAVMPDKLDAIGGIGELAVQLRTARPDQPYDDLLASFATATQQQAAKRLTSVPGKGYVCKRCGIAGHWLEQCSAEKPPHDQKRPPVPPPESKYMCKLCQVPGHWIDRCPQKRSAALVGSEPTGTGNADGSSGDGGGGGRGGAGTADACPPAQDDACPPAQDCAPSAKKSKHGTKPPKGYLCDACHVANDHYLTHCPRYAEYKAGPPPKNYLCKRCGMAGHWLEQCTALIPWKAHTAADGRADKDVLIVAGEEAREVGEELAESLEEQKPEVISTIQRVVQLVGEEASRQLLVQTWAVEDSGGLLTLDGTNRRRTPGGVFLWLVKQKLNEAQRAQIFSAPRPAKPEAGLSGVQGE